MTDAIIIKTIRGLLEIAKIAMPDTYYASDSRIIRARALLQQLHAKKARHARHSD